MVIACVHPTTTLPGKAAIVPLPVFSYIARLYPDAPPLGHGVTAINTEVGSSNVLRSIGQQEGNGTHQVDWLAHLALGDERGPLSLQVWVVVEDLLGAVGMGISIMI